MAVADLRAVSKEVVVELGTRLLDTEQPFAKRYRCLFSLMNVKASEETRKPLLHALREQKYGALLRHEVAYVLGQMQDSNAEVISLLKSVLKDETDDVMVRHEAAEALGAIAEDNCKETLQEHLADACREVAETCELALRRINDQAAASEKDKDNNKSESQFNTVDPTLVSKEVQERAVTELEAVALDESVDMHDRYEAIFAIRNKGGSVAIDLLSKLLRSSGSALLKHEVAFVLGQLQNEEATQILVDVLKDSTEHAMVRHEAAEALGSVANTTQNKEIFALLEAFCKDKVLAVAQSCEVALDMLKNEGEFEYCETLN
jgi:deoxyhypusine monooxygenase